MIGHQVFMSDHVPHQQNAHADALASLAASLALPAGATEKYSFTVATCTAANSPLKTVKLQEETFKSRGSWILTSLEPEDWRFPCIDFVLYGILADDPNKAAAIRRKAPRSYYNAIMQTLYRRSYDEILLQCLSHRGTGSIQRSS